jgi:ADP-ribose pyrophosphatase YjhB (NUDIX family)
VPTVTAADGYPTIGRGTAAWLRIYRLLAWCTQAKFTIGALVLVRRAGGEGKGDDEVLLVRQRLRTPSLWGLPGGFKKAYESAAAAGARELREETGLELRVRDGDLAARYEQPWAHHVDTLFVIQQDAGSAATARRASPEIAAVGWFATGALPPLTREAVLALRSLPDAHGEFRPADPR